MVRRGEETKEREEWAIPSRPLRILAMVCLALAVASFVVSFVLQSSGESPDVEGITIGIAFVALSTVGALIVLRRGNPVGWLMLLDGLVVSLTAAGAIWAMTGGPGAAIGQWFAVWGWNAGLAMIPLLFLLYPTGRPPSAGWRWVMRVTAAAAGLLVVLSAFGQVETGFVNPIGIPALVEVGLAIGPILLDGFLVLAVVSVIALIVRFIRSDGLERRQIGWLLYAAAVFILVVTALDLLELNETLESILYGAAYLSLPVAIGIAVFRYRLYEIDRIVNRTVTYTVVVVALAAVYLGGVAALGALVGSENPLAVAAATLAAAALFTPVRRSVQGWVDRRFSRSKYDAQRVVEDFTTKLRDEVDLLGLSTELRRVVNVTLRPTMASLWLMEER
ncbi:MAG TPA: hypothetical protein VHM94_11450 [Acidimicrobiia bacterium]|nr:hypothetical protein [Acidimicrobiia bacterium]